MAEKDAIYPACGLTFGGLPTSKSTVYTANITIDVYGTATDVAGNVSPVKQSLTATVQSL